MSLQNKRASHRALRFAIPFFIVSGLIILLTGCLYPGEQQEGHVSYRESVDRIQLAVDRFQTDYKVLPIFTAGVETPKFEKYLIDLDLLQKQGYIDQIPATAFEKGGSAYFLIIDEEVNPTVKVMDLVTAQKINDVRRRVSQYYDENGKWPVLNENEVYPRLYEVDLKLAGAEKYALSSVYSGQPQRYIMDEEGQVYADYAFDIMQAIQKSDRQPEEAEDLRKFLTEQSYFVPVKSLPYFWINNEPVAQTMK